MTVQELIDLLSRFPPDLPITVDGFEGGLTEKVFVERLRVEPNAWAGVEYVGEHEEEWTEAGTMPIVNIGRWARFVPEGMEN